MASLRVHLTHSNTVNDGWMTSSPAPAYHEHHAQRSKSSMPVRIIRRLTYREPQQLDPDTIPVLTKREQRRLAKRAQKHEQRQLDALVAYQRKKFHDEVSQQWETSKSARGDGVKQSRSTRVKNKVKDTIRRTKKVPAHNTEGQNVQPVAADPSDFLHIEQPSSKNTSNTYFQPSDVEASPPPAQESFLAELPAESSSISEGDFPGKTNFNHHSEVSPLSPPPPVRSPSPCLSALPRRGITVSETLAGPSSRQMQCDYCHGAIRLTGYHYACNVCNDGDCLYCAKCTNEGNTCRHELVERTRNIKRHPTNPSQVERRSLSVEDSLSDSGSHSAELSGACILPKAPHIEPRRAETASVQTLRHDSPVSPIDAETLLRDFEAKRREQEIAFREKEVTLREREAMLREREAWTATRERDAALVQQLHAAAMLQQSTETGPQFTSASRRNSRIGTISRQSSAASQTAASFGHHAPSVLERSGSVVLHPHEIARKPIIALSSSMAAMEASFEGMALQENGVRHHGNTNKRKAASSSSSKDRSTARSTSTSKPSNNQRTPSRNSNEDPDEHEDDDESDGASPKRQKSSSSNNEPQKSFACPYSKYDPSRYVESNMAEIHYRSCSGGLYRDISRVKQHLKRIHHRPDFYCQRCFEEFDSSDKLRKHYSSPKSCDVKDCPWPERLDETKQSKIHVKRPGKDPKELWFEIYGIIFPGSTRPESPYIERTQASVVHPEILIQFIDLFNRRLDLASDKSWLRSTGNRKFLSEQMTQVLQEMQVQSSNVSSVGVPSVVVSPISPSADFHNRTSSHSSRASSAMQLQSPVSPPPTASTVRPSSNQAKAPMRPALKVDSSYGGSSEYAFTNSSANSAMSYRSSSFPRIPQHVREDSGYGQEGESWALGDDVHIMGDSQMPMPEPSSATSIRSTKSVSFATPEQEEPLYSEPQPQAPSFLDFARCYGNTQDFTREMDLDHQRILSDFEANQKRPFRHRADSAYGTLSSRHPSSSSLANQYPNSPPSEDTAIYHGTVRTMTGSVSPSSHWYPEPLICVNPQVLLRESMDGIAGHADLQAYLNRDMGDH